MRRLITAEEYIQARVAIAPSGCWEWLGARNRDGYGRSTFGNRQHAAHRLSYEAFEGPIETGRQVHHECCNRGCVNPAHLRVVTGEENNRLSRSVGAVNAAKTHCVHGHPFDEDNTVRTGHGWRACRICTKERERVRAERHRLRALRDRQCKNGHPRTPENTYVTPQGTKRCLVCKREGKRKLGGYLDPSRARPTHCPHGHEYTPENTYEYVRDGRSYRYCRTCNRQKARELHARKRLN